LKLCLAFSAGGHFTEMRMIIDPFKDHDIFYATIKAKSTENLPNSYYLRNTASPTKIHYLFNFFIVIIQSLIILFKEKPKVIVSTGADVTIPLCFFGKLFQSKIIFIESICRVKDISPTGKILYLFSDIFFVQWDNLIKKYNKAIYRGRVL
jgi:UDP-N-acetylglucosamine:LPS N-acetylglucosamine transferase